jgi:hypothetical protein
MLKQDMKDIYEEFHLLGYNTVQSVVFQRVAQRYILDDTTLHNHCCGNLKSYTISEDLICLFIYHIFNVFSNRADYIASN